MTKMDFTRIGGSGLWGSSELFAALNNLTPAAQTNLQIFFTDLRRSVDQTPPRFAWAAFIQTTTTATATAYVAATGTVTFNPCYVLLFVHNLPSIVEMKL